MRRLRYADFELVGNRPAYLQIKDYLATLILKGLLQKGERLPATRELSLLFQVSRNTIVQAYQVLEVDNLIEIIKGQGAFVTGYRALEETRSNLDWENLITEAARQAVSLDLEKHELKWERGMISFKSIAPDQTLFDVTEFKKAFLNRITLEGEKLLNYGYARGYRPFLEYLEQYLQHKGVNTNGKEILITNGFTEALNLILRVITRPGDQIICENPTHNTALKIMKLFGLEICGVPMRPEGIDLAILEQTLVRSQRAVGYLIPSYHNPTGLVMTPEKRLAVLELFQKYQTPLIEDGFNEELRYSGAHVASLLALDGTGNQVVYLGSFSKILFPGLRIGWIVADHQLISYLESIKRSLNIHTSFLDQAVLVEYLQSGAFEKYLKKACRVYKEKYETAVNLARELIPARRIWGEGGLHLWIELEELDARAVLAKCYQRGVVFMPGDLFFTDNSGQNTFRLGISRVDAQTMRVGFQIIGEAIRELLDL